jgi:7-carboxy-7-deazaguanine synthase
MRVVERLLTLCGETHLAGVPCVLVRFAGCDLRCSYCDTIYARDRDAAAEEVSAEDLAQWVLGQGLGLALLTGGEPLLQPELPRLAEALARRVTVLVETSGALDISPLRAPVVRSVDIKGPSSGEAERMCWENLDRLRPGDCVKFVVAGREDYEHARGVIRDRRLGAPVNILLSSAYPHLEPSQLAAWIIEDRLDARLNVQLHKVLWPQLERR